MSRLVTVAHLLATVPLHLVGCCAGRRPFGLFKVVAGIDSAIPFPRPIPFFLPQKIVPVSSYLITSPDLNVMNIPFSRQ